MKIEFIPLDKKAEFIIPPPKPAKLYIPEWYKNIKQSSEIDFNSEGKALSNSGDIKRCMPFLDMLTAGYIQESWTDIYIKKQDNDVSYHFPIGPTIMKSRNNANVKVSNIYYPYEFVWQVYWLPRLPKGWSALFTSVANRFDLPFRTLDGIIDSDSYNHAGGNLPFFINKDFEGIIPAGTPMYQIIPIKRESWKSEIVEFDEDTNLKKYSQVRKYIFNGYKKDFWHKKNYE